MAVDAPIFIVGAARSGTTLMRNLLNRHPSIAICNETHFHHYVYKRRGAFGDLANPRNRERVIREYLALWRLWFVGDRGALSEKLMREATTYQELFSGIARHDAELYGKERWGEKTPQHALFSQTLCDWYPGATLIHMIRDPRDVVASMQRMPFAADSVVQNAWKWREWNLAAQRCSDRPQYLEVRYETLVARPEQELRRICERLGEKFVPSMLDPRERPEAPTFIPWMKRAEQSVTTERLGKWQEELTPKEVAQIEWTVGRHLETFGYQRTVHSPSALTIGQGLGFALFDNARRRIPQLPGIWYYLFRPTKLAKEEYWTRRRAAKEEGSPRGRADSSASISG
jgi:hypothetical protein